MDSSMNESETKLKDKTFILNEHDGNSFIVNGLKSSQLVDRFHWLDEPEKLPYELNCNHLIHYTENKLALNIGFDNPDYFSFKSHKCNLLKENEYHFVWWTAVAPDGWDAGVNRENPAHAEFFEKYFCNSGSFKGESLCGPIGFQISWKNILEQYASSRGKQFSQIQLKKFGTFLYTREKMYAIIVCVEGDTILFKDDNGIVQEFSKIDTPTEAFEYIPNNETFKWKVYSTTKWNPSGNPDCIRATWDHLAFAMYFPNMAQTLNISPNLCIIKTKEATEYRPKSRENKNNRTPKEMIPDIEVVQRLCNKINRQ